MWETQNKRLSVIYTFHLLDIAILIHALVNNIFSINRPLCVIYLLFET